MSCIAVDIMMRGEGWGVPWSIMECIPGQWNWNKHLSVAVRWEDIRAWQGEVSSRMLAAKHHKRVREEKWGASGVPENHGSRIPGAAAGICEAWSRTAENKWGAQEGDRPEVEIGTRCWWGFVGQQLSTSWGDPQIGEGTWHPQGWEHAAWAELSMRANKGRSMTNSPFKEIFLVLLWWFLSSLLAHQTS